jgi:hypothetical protein
MSKVRVPTLNLRRTWPRALSPGNEGRVPAFAADEAGCQPVGNGGPKFTQQPVFDPV